LGRFNHDRVALINKALKEMGFITWFDSDRMTGDIVDQMVTGSNNASVVIVFITQRYMNKVNGSDANDNCRKEFKYATQTKSSTKMIPVVMEPRMKDIRGNWTDLMKMELGSILYIDFSNDNDLQATIQHLRAEILSRTTPLWVLKSGSSTAVEEVTTSLPAHSLPALQGDDSDLFLIDQLKSWFVSLHISASAARGYARLLVEKNTGTVAKLQRKLERNSNYLEEIGGFDEDDIIDIKERLKLPTSGKEERTPHELGLNSLPSTPGHDEVRNRSSPSISPVTKPAKEETAVKETVPVKDEISTPSPKTDEDRG
jgi:hypothetical protein